MRATEARTADTASSELIVVALNAPDASSWLDSRHRTDDQVASFLLGAIRRVNITAEEFGYTASPWSAANELRMLKDLPDTTLNALKRLLQDRQWLHGHTTEMLLTLVAAQLDDDPDLPDDWRMQVRVILIAHEWETQHVLDGLRTAFPRAAIFRDLAEKGHAGYLIREPRRLCAHCERPITDAGTGNICQECADEDHLE
jgi:hypothetical protein